MPRRGVVRKLFVHHIVHHDVPIIARTPHHALDLWQQRRQSSRAAAARWSSGDPSGTCGSSGASRTSEYTKYTNKCKSSYQTVNCCYNCCSFYKHFYFIQYIYCISVSICIILHIAYSICYFINLFDCFFELTSINFNPFYFFAIF